MSKRASPADVRFEYEEALVVPVAAYDPSGQPYDGNAEGANGAADWSGPYVAGRPHGIFQVYWGGIRGGTCEFRNGVLVK